MASVRLSGTQHRTDGAEEPSRLLGAVLRAAPSGRPALLAPGGPLLITDVDDARAVLTRADDFALPFNVSRRRIRGDGVEGKSTPPLTRPAVDAGLRAFADELALAEPSFVSPGLDTLAFLRRPVARSTTAALVPEAGPAARDEIGDLVLDWVDALGPVISATRRPGRWSSASRAERRALGRLVGRLTAIGCPAPPARAAALAAGVQVPIAAGAWCLTQLAAHPRVVADLRGGGAAHITAPLVVWEILRMFPPSWMLPRVSTRAVALGDTTLPAYTALVVSPLALGRLPQLAPGPDAGCSSLDVFDPARWSSTGDRPGAWLPFGAGPNACPGRNLALAQLTHLVSWAVGFELTVSRPPAIDTTRGLSPAPSLISVGGTQ